MKSQYKIIHAQPPASQIVYLGKNRTKQTRTNKTKQKQKQKQNIKCGNNSLAQFITIIIYIVIIIKSIPRYVWGVFFLKK